MMEPEASGGYYGIPWMHFWLTYHGKMAESGRPTFSRLLALAFNFVLRSCNTLTELQIVANSYEVLQRSSHGTISRLATLKQKKNRIELDLILVVVFAV